ncbi:MAG: class E sortase [Candidatus Ancillula sp.]|jgi:LPXTG-site transpeptidase (sortase) family protein|nr:class E sortase [Candidatus Ancillula sp.]
MENNQVVTSVDNNDQQANTKKNKLSRKTSRKSPKKLGVFGRSMAIFSDLLLTAAVIIGLYLIYLVWWTGVVANFAQQDLAKQFTWDMPVDITKVATPHYDNIPCTVEPTEVASMIGRIYIPHFGADYVRNLVEGTDKTKVLDLQGFGHYSKTAMPGCVGNFASAGHRGGFGNSLLKIDELKSGDTFAVRTQHFWFVYELYKHEVVDADHGEVLDPIPSNTSSYVSKDAEQYSGGKMSFTPREQNEAHERLATFTTCNPRWQTINRYIAHFKLKYWANIAGDDGGVPKELLDVGVKIVS